MFDGELDQAVRKFQVRHGISSTGKIDEPTFYALQVTADQRLAQLQLNLQRVQAVATEPHRDRYVVVNIPAASIEAVEGGHGHRSAILPWLAASTGPRRSSIPRSRR